MSGYIFILNSTKPTEEELNSRDAIKLGNFELPALRSAVNRGYDVVLGVNRNNPEKLRCADIPIKLYDSHTYRSIVAIKDNYIAYKNLVKAIRKYHVEVIHCNTPIGGMVGRLAGKRCKVPRVIYTAHGFHFYKGAPLFNRTILYLAEKLMARWTDAIITMNEEDYTAAKKFRLRKGGKVYKVHGVGIDISQYEDIRVDIEKKRAELGLTMEDILCISAGDLVARKNYKTAISAVSKVKNPHIHYLICGVGEDREKLERYAEESGVGDRVHFLGYRTDMKELLMSADIFFFTSLQEGLPRSLMEAMACGLPCVVSGIRGNVDLIRNKEGGYLASPFNAEGFAKRLDALAGNKVRRRKMGEANKAKIKEYDIHVVCKEIDDIYDEVL